MTCKVTQWKQNGPIVGGYVPGRFFTEYRATLEDAVILAQQWFAESGVNVEVWRSKESGRGMILAKVLR